MPLTRITLAFVVAASAAVAAQQGIASATLAEIEKRIESADVVLSEAKTLAARLRAELTPPVVEVGCADDERARADAFQQVLDTIPGGGTVLLEPGCTYTGYGFVNQSTGFHFTGRPGGTVTITTRGYVPSPASGHAGRITPRRAGQVASLRAGTANVGYGLEVRNGTDGGQLALVGVQFLHNLPRGHGDMLRIGSDTETDPANLATRIRVSQVVFQGDETFGQKRAISAMGRDIVVEQSWFEDIFMDGQDSQAVASWNGGKGVTVRFNYMQVGSEPVLIGGSKMAGTTDAMSPEDWLIEDNIMHRPLRWQTDGRKRQVKNLLEFKFGRRITARRNLLVNNWVASQAGAAILVTYTTNGRCPHCPGLHDVLLEDNVVLNAAAGIEISGAAYGSDTLSPERLRNLVIRNNYLALTGGASSRTIMMANLKGRHNVRIERNTFINGTMQNWLTGEAGSVWEGPTDGTAVRVRGLPMQGLWLLENVFTHSGRYGATFPGGGHWSEQLATAVDADLQVSGNVFGDHLIGVVSPTTGLQVARTEVTRNLAAVNKVVAGGPVNTVVPKADLLATLPAAACGEAAPGKGAACARLVPVFALRQYLPEP